MEAMEAMGLLFGSSSHPVASQCSTGRPCLRLACRRACGRSAAALPDRATSCMRLLLGIECEALCLTEGGGESGLQLGWPARRLEGTAGALRRRWRQTIRLEPAGLSYSRASLCAIEHLCRRPVATLLGAGTGQPHLAAAGTPHSARQRLQGRSRLTAARPHAPAGAPPPSAAAMGGRPTAAPPEGRAWWLELQRQRAQAGSGTSSQPPGEAANAPAEGQHGDGLARRRTSLLRDSEALLRRMSRPIPQPSGSSLGDSHGTSASAAAATPPAGSPAAAPAPLQRSVSTRCSSLAGARDAGRAASSEEMHLLLEGGLIG